MVSSFLHFFIVLAFLRCHLTCAGSVLFFLSSQQRSAKQLCRGHSRVTVTTSRMAQDAPVHQVRFLFSVFPCRCLAFLLPCCLPVFLVRVNRVNPNRQKVKYCTQRREIAEVHGGIQDVSGKETNETKRVSVPCRGFLSLSCTLPPVSRSLSFVVMMALHLAQGVVSEVLLMCLSCLVSAFSTRIFERLSTPFFSRHGDTRVPIRSQLDVTLTKTNVRPL